jgi:hypothetical protein
VRLLLTAIVALLAGLLTHVLLLFFVLQDPFSFEDLMGISVTSVVYSLPLFPLVYLPGLLWLRKQLGGAQPLFYFPVFAALVLNLPAAAVLGSMYKLGGAFSAGEVALFLIQFAIAGAVFGLGFVWHSRRGVRRGQPASFIGGQ